VRVRMGDRLRTLLAWTRETGRPGAAEPPVP
jgi:hypothetical protein